MKADRASKQPPVAAGAIMAPGGVELGRLMSPTPPRPVFETLLLTAKLKPESPVHLCSLCSCAVAATAVTISLLLLLPLLPLLLLLLLLLPLQLPLLLLPLCSYSPSLSYSLSLLSLLLLYAGAINEAMENSNEKQPLILLILCLGAWFHFGQASLSAVRFIDVSISSSAVLASRRDGLQPVLARKLVITPSRNLFVCFCR